MKPEEIQRINELAKKQKEEGLTPEERVEQAELRSAYLAAVRRNFRATLDNTYVQRPDGSKAKLVRVSGTEDPDPTLH